MKVPKGGFIMDSETYLATIGIGIVAGLIVYDAIVITHKAEEHRKAVLRKQAREQEEKRLEKERRDHKTAIEQMHTQNEISRKKLKEEIEKYLKAHPEEEKTFWERVALEYEKDEEHENAETLKNMILR